MPGNIVKFQSSYAEPYPLQVQGESNYKANIEDVSNYTGEDEGVDADDFIAHLILEDDNIYDPGNAVRIEIDGKAVGYLAKPAAKKYRKRLAELGLSDVTGECYASIKGGFIKRSSGEQADFGVRLDLDLDTFNVPAAKQESKPVDRAPVPPIVSEIKQSPAAPTQKTSVSAPNKFLDWFFAPSKNRAWRIALFSFLFLCLCGACLIIIPAIIAGNP